MIRRERMRMAAPGIALAAALSLAPAGAAADGPPIPAAPALSGTAARAGSGSPAAVSAIADVAITARPSGAGAASAVAAARIEAVAQAAWTWGSRRGLAWRVRRICERLKRLSPQLDAAFAFDALVIEDGGRRLLPPVAQVSRNAFHVAGDGQRLATARTVVRILAPERLITAAPRWRSWLPEAEPPPDEPPGPPAALFPRDEGEKTRWEAAARAGFRAGIDEEDAIFADRLERLATDFIGMTAWWRLRLEGKASAPVVSHRAQAVRGGGDKMSLLTRVSAIESPSRLDPLWRDWRPAPAAAKRANDPEKSDDGGV